MNELNHGPGKGDLDRSPRWRDNYNAISFPDAGLHAALQKQATPEGQIALTPVDPRTQGFRRHSTGWRKTYK